MKILSAAAVAAAILFFTLTASASVSNEGSSIWIPEHRCLQKFGSEKCYLHRCMKKCSEKPAGRGRCRGNFCICTYYCHQPPK